MSLCSIDEEEGSKVYSIDPAGNCWSYRVGMLVGVKCRAWPLDRNHRKP